MTDTHALLIISVTWHELSPYLSQSHGLLTISVTWQELSIYLSRLLGKDKQIVPAI
jgi:hypothetical protein